MKVNADLFYSREDEWVRREGEIAWIGITDYAQDALGEIVFVELPEPGANVRVGDACAVIESVKAASDIYIPVSGTVLQVNEVLAASPEKINEDAYGSWICTVQMEDPSELDALMDAAAYEAYRGKEG